MQLTIVGSTGGTGQRLIEQALAAGHRVVAVARRPEAVTARHPGLRVVGADVLDAPSLDKAVADADAVVSALGIGYRRHATTVYSAGTANVMAAMRRAGVRRLVCVSTAGLTVPSTGPVLHRLVLRHILHRLLSKPYQDMSRMEELVTGSDTDWTIVRAARLTNGRPSGRYRTSRPARTFRAPGPSPAPTWPVTCFPVRKASRTSGRRSRSPTRSSPPRAAPPARPAGWDGHGLGHLASLRR